MRLALTHILWARARSLTGPRRARDALARVISEGESAAVEAAVGRSVFVPGWLPCGDCGPCRRALTAACTRPSHWIAEAGDLKPGAEITVADRFICLLDESGVPIESSRAIAAGLGARLLEAAGRAGLVPGQVALWFGNNGLAAAGTAWSRRRGCTAIHVPHDPSPQIPDDVAVQLTEAESSAATGFVERTLFVTFDAGVAPPAVPPHWLRPGSTIVHLPETTSDQDPGALAVAQVPGTLLDLPAGARVFHAGLWPHPDFIPEALAALGRGDLDAALLLGENHDVEGP